MKYLLLFLLTTFSLNFAGETQWKTVLPNVACDLNVISIVNKNIIWLGSEGGYISRTNDGGTNWITYKIGDTPVTSMCGVNDSICFAVINKDSSTQILKTDDGGENWLSVFELEDPRAFINNIYMFDKQHGVAIGYPINGKYLILTSDNQGVTWKRETGITADDDNEISITNTIFGLDNYGWFGTNSANIYVTKDKGLTWKKIKTNLSGIYSISFIDSLNGIIGGAGTNGGPAPLPEPHISLTKNGGQTWQEVSVKFYPKFIKSAVMIDHDNFMYLVHNIVLQTKDGGNNWEKVYSSDNDLNGMYLKRSQQDISCWLLGEKASLAQFVESTTNIANDKSIVKKFQLLYNYPNPFNPETEISFILPYPSKVVIEIFNARGEKVGTPINSFFSAGIQSVRIRMNKFASGIYIYRIKAGKYHAFGKMVLIK